MEQLIEQEELRRRRAAEPGLFPGASGPAQHLPVEIRLRANAVMDPLAARHQFWHDFVDLFDGQRLIHAEGFHRRLRAEQNAFPQFLLRILRLAEQHGLALLPPRNEREQGLGFGEPGQIIEIAVLAVGVVDIAAAHALRRRGEQGDGAGAELRHQRRPALVVFR